MSRVLLRLGIAVPLDGQMHTTWAFRLMDALRLTEVAHALGIGCVPDRQLHRWACQREQRERRTATLLLYELGRLDPAAALEFDEARRGTFG